MSGAFSAPPIAASGQNFLQQLAPTPSPFPQGQNPLQMLDTLGQAQERQLQVRQLVQGFAAKQKAGAIISQAPDLESGLAAAAKDPDVMAFAGDTLTNARQMQNILTQTAGLQMKQNGDAVQSVLRSAAAAGQDPSRLKDLIGGSMATLPKEVQQRVQGPIQSYMSALLTDLPSDPQQRSAVYRQRLTGLLTSAGMTPDTIAANVGDVHMVDAGDRIIPMLSTGPGQSPFQYGPAVAKGMTPQLTTVPNGDGSQSPVVASGMGQVNPLLGPAAGNGAVGPGIPNGAPSGPANAGGPPNGLPAAPAAQPYRTLTPGEAETQRRTAQAQVDIKNSLQSSYQSLAAQNVKDTDEEFKQNLKAGRPLMNTINGLQQAMTLSQTGGGAGLRTNIGQIAQAMKNAGIPIAQGTIDKIANGSLSESEFVKQQILGVGLTQLRESQQGLGRAMQVEFAKTLGSLDQNTDPNTILQILDKAKFSASMGMDMAQKWPAFRDQAMKGNAPGGLGPQDYAQWYDANHAQDFAKRWGNGVDVSSDPLDRSKGKGVTYNKATMMRVPRPDGSSTAWEYNGTGDRNDIQNWHQVP